MQTALQTLMQSAPVCRPLKVDLQRSTITLDWPANVLVQRTDYVLVPKVAVDDALSNEKLITIFETPSGRGRYEHILTDRDFEFSRRGIECTVYFSRFPHGEYPKPPFTWYGSISMVDRNGLKWTRSLPRMVTNDFGDLVDLTTGERP